ncbi:MAG: hypothetical protein CMQ23_00835 [Gammaproteobacteria bacterium]|nr:hypothetical protein [Gammaproteobacteria bacterium]
MTEPDERDLDLPSTEEVLSDHHRSKASFPLRVLITLMVIGMIGLGAAGYLLFESQRRLSISAAENADRLTVLASFEARQSELFALVKSHAGKLATQGDAINELRLATAPLLSRQTRISTSALIAELNVLLRTAVLALSLNGDTTLAAELLDEAIRMIAAESLPGLADLQAALIDDRTSMRSFVGVDTTETYLMLESARLWLVALQRRSPGDRDFAEREGGQAPLATGSWESLADRLLEQLSSLVDFRRNEAPIQLPPSPDDEALLVQRQLLLLQSAQLALLQQNQTVFRSSIEEIERQTNAYFVVPTDDPVWQSIMSLKTISIDALPPTIDRSLGAYERLRASVEAASK